MYGGLLKSASALAILAAAGLYGVSPAKAADLGGDCCADLEERVAELEATTARKGNRKVSLQISGQISQQLMFWDDGFQDDVYVSGPTQSNSRWRMSGTAKISPEITAGFLPRTHGSVLFTRGETQAIVSTTLGTKESEQMIDGLEGLSYQRFMLHYNFPPYSVGEVGRFGAPGRRKVGHGKLAWRGFSTGPDSETLMDPEKTTHLGKPVGKDSGINTWEGDQWKIGGGTTWGWYSYDKDLNLVYYGTGNPSTWNPVQRPGDNRWSMTIFARDVDTGMAKWVYQMTPHDEWDYDGVNEMILADIPVKGQQTKALVHFDRNGFAYTLNRETGELLVAEKFDPAVNWATHVDMETGRPEVVSRYSTQANGEDVNTTNICPAALATKDQQPAAFSPKTGLFYVPTNHVCMDYEPYQVSYTAGQPYVGATVNMYAAPGGTDLGNFIAWDASEGKIVWSLPERFSVWSGALSTAGGVVFYGTLEGYLKAVDAKTGKELFKFKTPSGIIGNVTTYEHGGKQYVAVLSGVGGWAGIGLAAGLTNPTDGLGAVGGYAALRQYTALGGQLTVFALPSQ